MTKNRFYLAGLGAAAAIALIPWNGAPLISRVFDAGSTIAENVAQRPKVQLKLEAEKQIVEQDKVTGKEKITWQALSNGATVQPGDTLRYQIQGQNEGNLEAKNLTVVQPVPKGTTYVLKSASGNGTTATYSIDDGKTFVTNPTIQVKLADGTVKTRPAPAEVYTHIRWSLNQSLQPKGSQQMNYAVKVR